MSDNSEDNQFPDYNEDIDNPNELPPENEYTGDYSDDDISANYSVPRESPYHCSKFVNPNDVRDSNSSPGYFTSCKGSCNAGFVQEFRCGGKHKACSDKCTKQDGCNAGTGNGRGVCRRLESNFKPARENNIYSKCCIIESPETRRANDCPPDYSLMKDPSNISKVILSSACLDLDRNFCMKSDLDNIVNDRCDKFYKDLTLNDKTEYNNRMKEYIHKDLERLNHIKSTKWASENRTLINHNRVTELCSSEKGSSKEYEKACGCHYPTKIYDDIRTGLSTKYRVPENVLTGGRKCYVPQCNRAEIQFDPSNHTCPSTSFVTCVQEINVNAANGTIGEININASQECTSEYGRGNSGGGGGDGDGGGGNSGGGNSGGGNSGGGNSGGGNSGGGNSGGGGNSDEEEPTVKKDSWFWLWVTIGIVGGLLFLILIIYVVWKYSNNSPEKSDDIPVNTEQNLNSQYYQTNIAQY